MVRRAGWGLVLVLGLAGMALAAPRARLTLQDGSVIEGELTRFAGGTYELSVGGRQLTFAEREVRRVELLPEVGAEPAAPAPARVDLSRMGRYDPRAGDRRQISEISREEQETSYELVEQIEAVDPDGRIKSRVRTYTHLDGRKLDRPAEVVVTRVGLTDELRWLTPAGEERSRLERLLQSDLGGDRGQELGDWRPQEPVVADQPWTLGPDVIPLGRIASSVTLERVTQEGRLVRSYAREGQPWAEVRLLVSATIVASRGIELPTPGALRLELTVRGPVDGSSCALEEELRAEVDMRPVIPLQTLVRQRKVAPLAARADAAAVDLSRLDGYRPREGDRWRVSHRDDATLGLGVEKHKACTVEQEVQQLRDGRPVRLLARYTAYQGPELPDPRALLEKAWTLRIEGQERELSGPNGAPPPGQKLLRPTGEPSLDPALWRPARLVRPEESWPLSPAAIEALMGGAKSFTPEVATGRFLGSEVRDGEPWGTVVLEVTGTVATKGAPVTTSIQVTIRAPLDGGSAAREQITRSHFVPHQQIPDLDLEVKSVVTTSRQPLAGALRPRQVR